MQNASALASHSSSKVVVRSSFGRNLYFNVELGHDSDGECYSEYEANLKPLLKRGTYEQFLSIYIPGQTDDSWYFMLACESNQMKMAEHIYNTVPRINVNGYEEDLNALSLAAQNKNMDLVRWLLTLNGVDVRGKFVRDYPLLTYAVSCGFPSDIIMKLIDLGARPTEYDAEFEIYPLQDALKDNRLDIAMYLLMHDFDPYFYLPDDEMTAFDCEMTPEAESLLFNYRSIMLKYCLDETGSAVSADEFAMIADFARLELPEDLMGEEEDEE